MENKKYLIDNKELMKEWDWNKNESLDPNKIVFGSEKKAWWICSKCNNTWQTTIYHRAVRNQGCPKCGIIKRAKSKRTPKDGESLYDKNPLLINEWNWMKNKDIDPKSIKETSPRKVWWVCEKGHEWEARINKRVLGNGCPICYSTTKTSFAEQVVFWYLSKVTNVIHRYNFMGKEIDVYLSDFNVGIEYDGIFWHKDSNTIEREKRKNKFLKDNGIKLIRIKEINNNDTIIDNKDCYTIFCKYEITHQYLQKVLIELSKLLNQITNTNIFNNIKFDLDNDRAKIIEFFKVKDLEDSLYNKYPQIAKEWDYEYNNNLSPKDVSCGSNLKVWWICGKGHRYSCRIAHRTNGIGCSICSGRKLEKGYNDLVTTDPELVKEWNFKKNIIKPNEVSHGSGKTVWWICEKGHEWESKILNRTINRRGCPMCSGRYAIPGINDLTTKHPEILKEWDYEKNNKQPTELLSGSSYKAWWICNECHSYQMPVYRKISGRGCPICRKKKRNH